MARRDQRQKAVFTVTVTSEAGCMDDPGAVIEQLVLDNEGRAGLEIAVSKVGDY